MPANAHAVGTWQYSESLAVHVATDAAVTHDPRHAHPACATPPPDFCIPAWDPSTTAVYDHVRLYEVGDPRRRPVHELVFGSYLRIGVRTTQRANVNTLKDELKFKGFGGNFVLFGVRSVCGKFVYIIDGNHRLLAIHELIEEGWAGINNDTLITIYEIYSPPASLLSLLSLIVNEAMHVGQATTNADKLTIALTLWTGLDQCGSFLEKPAPERLNIYQKQAVRGDASLLSRDDAKFMDNMCHRIEEEGIAGVLSTIEMCEGSTDADLAALYAIPGWDNKEMVYDIPEI
jgi:hypothetical protein